MQVIDADSHISEKERKDISDGDKEKLLRENAQRFYGWV